MEKDVKVGSVGELQISFAGGKAKVEFEGQLGSAGPQVGANVSEDAGQLVDKLFAAIEKASPPGAQPIEEAVKVIVKNAVLAIQ